MNMAAQAPASSSTPREAAASGRPGSEPGWSRLHQMDVQTLYDMLALRSQVFVVEQRCAYLDPDGVDRDSWHLTLRDGAALQGCLRVVDAGARYDEPSIGRVVVAPGCRGSGLGRALVAEGIARCLQAWPGRAIRIGAQRHLQAFYGSFGFQAVCDAYMEDGIWHVQMVRPC